jgi:hypothetical protein
MGKKKKPSTFDYFTGSGKLGKVMDRYDVKPASFGGRPGEWGGGDESRRRLPEDIDKELAKAAMNDYDTRRTLEAQAMAGKKKAQKYAQNGFKDSVDVIKANNMFERWHKKQGNGGDFSSASDYAGLTWNSVQRDREKSHRQFASIQDLNALRDDLEAQEEASQKQARPIEKSDALARAEDRLNQDYSPGSIYSQNNTDAATDNPPADASKHFLYDYRDKVKEKYGPLTNTEREVSNAAKRVQDAYGR